MARYLISCALLLLAACSRAPQPPEPSRGRDAGRVFNPGGGPALAPDPNDRRPVLVGYGVDAGLSYPDFLQKKIPHYRVVNAGISADTTTGALSRVSTIVALRPAIVVLEFGGNDGLRGLPLSATRDNMAQLVAQLKGAGAKVVLAGMTLPPNYGPDYIREFENIYKDLARKENLPLIPFLLEGVATPDGKFMQADGIHATAEGNRRVADTVYRYVQPYLAR
jgi:acyl-CoA thioesterase-1